MKILDPYNLKGLRRFLLGVKNIVATLIYTVQGINITIVRLPMSSAKER